MQPDNSQQENTEEAAALRAVLGSRSFSGAPTLAGLLSYLGDNYFKKRGSLNEYKIAVEALRRPEDFDPTNNSSVRVEMFRLRTKLKRFYETEGSDHRLRINIDGGDYRLQFVWQDGAQPASPGESADLNPGEMPETDEQLPASPPGVRAAFEKSQLIQFSFLSRKVLGIAAAVILVAIGFTWWMFNDRSHRRLAQTPQGHSSAAGVQPVTKSMEDGSILILAGNNRKHIDRNGRVWEGDQYFSGGHIIDLDFPYIQGTADETIYRSARVGTFSYDIPVNQGVYELRLHFVETAYGPGTLNPTGVGDRLFSILLGDRILLHGLDVFSDAGGSFRAYTRVFKGITADSDGKVHLRFTGDGDLPFVNAIELVPEEKGRLNPVRIVMQESPYRDRSGHLWISDEYAFGGQIAPHFKTPEGATETHFTDGERYGHFDYQIPVASGRYAVTMYFLEAYFGTIVPAGEDGGRLFDVYANGQALLRNFDVMEQAGGPYKVVSKTFHGIEPNAAGQIDLSFLPVRNYATVVAIEVTDETP